MRYIFILFLSLFLANGSSKAAEKVNIKFEEMLIPINIDQLGILKTYKNNSSELIDWFKKKGFAKVFELSKLLDFPVFKEEGLNRKVLRNWVGRKILTELSKTIIVPNDKNGIQVFNTIEELLEVKKEVTTLDIIKALPSQEIFLDVDNLILIIASWKEELLMQQRLTSKLNNLDKKNNIFFKKTENIINTDSIKIQKKIYAPHRLEPLKIEFWKNNQTSFNKDLIIFMPGLGGDINNFEWIGKGLSQRGWPIIFIDHSGSNSDTFQDVLEGKDAIPESADYFLYRLKDLNAVLEAHRNGRFGLSDNSYILMGHSLGALIALLYENNSQIKGLDNRCDLALKDFALTNLSKLLQCQLSEIPFPENNNNNKANAIIGFNAFGSLIWPKEKSSNINIPILLIGGTYDLITPLIGEQFKVFLSANNSLNRFLIIEGASHFSPIRIDYDNNENNDLFKINETFIGSNPTSVQDLSLSILVEFMNKLKKKEGLEIIKNQREINLDFHILDQKGVKEILNY